MLWFFVAASSAAAAPLAVVDSPTVPAYSSNLTNTTAQTSTAETNTAADAPLAEASDGRQRPWWERLSEKHRELHKGQSWCVVGSTHATLPRRPLATNTQLRPLPPQVATAPRDARGFKRGSARALYDLGSANAQRADGGCPPRLRSVLATIGATPDDAARGPLRHSHWPPVPLRRLLRYATPSARRPTAMAARKKADLGAMCSRGDPPHFGGAG